MEETTIVTASLVLVALFVGILFRFSEGLKWFYVFLTTTIPGPSLWMFLHEYLELIRHNDMNALAEALCALHGHKPFCVWLDGVFSVIVSDCETLNEVYKNRSLSDKPDIFYKLSEGFVGESLLTANGSKYRKHRKIVNPAFRKQVLESHLPRINNRAVKFVELLSVFSADGKSVDIRSLTEQDIFNTTVDICTSGTFTFSKGKSFTEGVQKGMSIIHLRTIHPWLYWWRSIVYTSFRKTMLQCYDFIKECGEEVFERSSEMAEASGSGSALDFISVVQESQGSDGYSVEDSYGDTRVFLIAGTETTSTVINICLLLLALNPDVQQRLLEEFVSIFGQSDRSVEPKDLSQMVYLDMVIKETMRLFPPLPLIGKLVREDTKICDITLPKGSCLAVSLHGLHRNPEVFQDPLLFDPMRFSPEFSQDRHPCAYLPFSSGVRNCPGQLQAYMVIKTYLYHVLRNFEIRPGNALRTINDIKAKMKFNLHLEQSSLRFCRRVTRA